MCRLVKKIEATVFVGDDVSTKPTGLEVVVTAESNRETSSLLSHRQSPQAAGDDVSAKPSGFEAVVTAEAVRPGPKCDNVDPSTLSLFSEHDSSAVARLGIPASYVDAPIGGLYLPVSVQYNHTTIFKRLPSSERLLAVSLLSLFFVGFTLFYRLE